MSIAQSAIAETELVVHHALARAGLYQLLAKSFRYPTEATLEFVKSPEYEDALQELCVLHSDNAELQQHADLLADARAQLCAADSRDVLEAEYNRLFAHLGSAKCPPYETEYGYDNVFQKSDAMADIAGFYAAYGLEPSSTDTERVDFISTEMEFMSYLALHEAYAREHDEAEHLEICLDTQKKFIGEHLGRWLSVFARILRQATDAGFYHHLGELAEHVLDADAVRLGIVLDKVLAPNPPEAQESFECARCSPISTENTPCDVVLDGVKGS
jgi:TorA maturation chaperone TorD